MSNSPTRDWRKKSHRLEKSRNEFKERNREKAEKIKASSGRALDLEHSRAQWKKKYEEKSEETDRLAEELASKNSLLEAEKKIRQEEARGHAEEMEKLKKKWQTLQANS